MSIFQHREIYDRLSSQRQRHKTFNLLVSITFDQIKKENTKEKKNEKEIYFHWTSNKLSMYELRLDGVPFPKTNNKCVC